MERATPYTPCRVHRVLVRGAEHTHESVVVQELYGLRGATTLGEIHRECAVAAAQLESLGVFESADFKVDCARDDGAAGDMPLADVIVTVSEKKRLASASTGVHTSGGEGSMDAEVRASLATRLPLLSPRVADIAAPAPSLAHASSTPGYGVPVSHPAPAPLPAGLCAQCVRVRGAPRRAHGGGAAQIERLPRARYQAAAMGN